MARFDATATAGSSATSPIAWNHTIGSGPNRVLIVGLAINSGTQSTVTAVTYGGVALTKVTSLQGANVPAGWTDEVSFWMLANPAVGTASISATATLGTTPDYAGASTSYFDANPQINATASTTNTNTAQGANNFNITTTADNSWIVALANYVNNGATQAVVTANQTSRQTQGMAINLNGEMNLEDTNGPKAVGVQTVGFTTSGGTGQNTDLFSAIAIAIGPALTQTKIGRPFRPRKIPLVVWRDRLRPKNTLQTAPLMSTLIDDFSSGVFDTTKWNTGASFGGAGNSVAVTSQQLVVTNDNASYEVVGSNNFYNIAGCAAAVQIVDTGAVLTSHEVGLRLYVDSVNLTWLFVGNGGISAWRTVGNVQTFIASGPTYNAAVHKYFRIREASGTFNYEWSTDYVTWNTFATLVNPYNTTLFYAQLYSGEWQTETSGSYGIFDNFNVAPAGTVLTLTQPSIARIANNITKTQPSVARIATNITKTQPSTARIANNRTLTQPSVARVANNRTVTQPSIARIAKTVTKTQPSVARVANNITKTQPATARIANNRTVTQPTIARVANNRTVTQPVNARIQKVVTKTQPVNARIQQPVSKTQPVTARIGQTGTKTQPTIARVANIVTKTQPVNARIQKTVTKTQPSVARVANNLTKTQPSIARISNNFTKTQPTVARIAVVATKTQPITARLQKTVTKTQPVTANIIQALHPTKTQPVSARIAVKLTVTQPVVASIRQVVSKTQPVTARISKNFTKTQPLTARIGQTYTKTQTVTALIIQNPPPATNVVTLDLSTTVITLDLKTAVVVELLTQQTVTLALLPTNTLTLDLSTNIINVSLQQDEVISLGIQ